MNIENDSRKITDLTTERLLLRSISEDDLHDLFLLRSDQEVNRYLDRDPARNLDDVKRFITATLEGMGNHDRMYWAVCLKDSSAFAGTICLWNFSDDHRNAEVGYELLPSFQGKGLMKEALMKIIEFAFTTLKLEVIEAYTHIDNTGSSKLLTNCGFVADPTKRAEENQDLILFYQNRNQ
jgi:[ribosomal protein S5]-alanine N-acetyltransferase